MGREEIRMYQHLIFAYSHTDGSNPKEKNLNYRNTAEYVRRMINSTRLQHCEAEKVLMRLEDEYRRLQVLVQHQANVFRAPPCISSIY
jgi:hypothetical protein